MAWLRKRVVLQTLQILHHTGHEIGSWLLRLQTPTVCFRSRENLGSLVCVYRISTGSRIGNSMFVYREKLSVVILNSIISNNAVPV